MNKKIGALITALCMTNGMAAYALTDEEIDQFIEDKIAEGAIDFGGDENAELGDLGQLPGHLPDYVFTNNDDPVGVRGICDYLWPAAEHPPMPVTVTFADGTSETKEWENDPPGSPPPDPTTSGVIASEWSLVEQGGPKKDTWQMKWKFTTTKPVKSIVLNGYDGGGRKDDSRKMKNGETVATVFDIRRNRPIEESDSTGTITDGSKNGYAFTFISPDDVNLTATYSYPIYIKDPNHPPTSLPASITSNMHDLYGTLTIDFEEPLLGSVDLEGLMIFRADTDCVLQIEGSLTRTDAGVELQYVGNDGDKGILTIDGEPHQRVLGVGGVGQDIGAGKYEVKMTLPKGHCYGLEGIDGTTGEWKAVAGPVCN